MGTAGSDRRGRRPQSIRHANALIWTREPSRERARGDGYAVAHTREACYEECDVVSLHVRLVDATRGIVSASNLCRMKPTALLVNTAARSSLNRASWHMRRGSH